MRTGPRERRSLPSLIVWRVRGFLVTSPHLLKSDARVAARTARTLRAAVQGADRVGLTRRQDVRTPMAFDEVQSLAALLENTKSIIPDELNRLDTVPVLEAHIPVHPVFMHVHLYDTCRRQW
jgi:hypothetical protein